MDTQVVRLTKIAVDPDLQPRVGGIDLRHVRDLEAGAEHWPPVSVVERGEHFVLVDGFHRLRAAKNLKLQTLHVTVLNVAGDEDLHALAFSINAKHGRPLSLKDRRAFGIRQLCSHTNWSDREIGRRSGLAQPTITKLRKELESRKLMPVINNRVGSDGRSYTVATQKNEKKVSLFKIIDEIAIAFDPNEQRKIVRYLLKLSNVLVEQDKLKGFKTFDDAAQACLKALGEKRAKELAERLVWSSLNIFHIARALGYREGGEP
jgi:ParB-like chromosome segregation protein Spo0J